jgi:putative glutathione S-transferase
VGTTCTHKLIREYDNLWPYLRDLYQTGVAERSEGTPNGRAGSETTRETPGVAETVNMDHITEHYYTTHPDVSPKRIVPMGPDPDFEAPHDRDELEGEPPADLLSATV